MKGNRFSQYIIFSILPLWLLSNPSVLTGQDIHQAKIDSLTLVLETTDSLDVKKKVMESLCILYRYEGNWKKLDQMIQEMLLLQEIEEDSAYLSDTYNQLGISNSLQGNNEESLQYFQKALIINKARGHMFGVSANYENMAEVHGGMGDYRSAVDCLLKSIEIKKEHNLARIFNIYIKLSSLQQKLKTGNADYYIELARQELHKMDSVKPEDKVVFYNQLGSIFMDRGMYDSSIVCNRNVVKYSRQIDWKNGIAVGLGNLAELFFKMGNIDSSIVYHRYSLQLSTELTDCDGITEEFLSLAKLYKEINRKDSVLILAKKSLRKAEECDLLPKQSEALIFIADYYHSQNDFEKAYAFLHDYHMIMDSISSADVKNNIAEMEAKYQNKVREQEIELLTAENQIKSQRLKVSILSVVVLTIFILLLLYAFFMRRRQAKFNENNLKQQLSLSQMNPHFIFNALGSIQNYLYKSEPKIVAGYLARFSFLIRSILSNSSKEHISLAEEIEILKSYIELEKLRLNNSFEYEMDYDDALETEFIKIPPMMIQPFVENAIKHGLKEGVEDDKLTISFIDEKEMLKVIITDNGIGINSSMKSNKSGHTSMALSIFNQRIQMIRKYSRKVPLPKIEDRSASGMQGTTVELSLPILN